MSTSPLKLVIQQLRTASERDGVGRTDGELLTRFLNQRDNDALAGLVERHAPMVWGVCRRILRNHHDAEDAFQATFIVLVRKAASVVPREMVGNWLYGVAYQTAVRLRAIAVKRGVRETQVIEMPEPVVAEARGDDLLLLLDQELSCLPEKYRVMIVLCDLESKTRIEVARQLGIPEGTVASRLARAREMLAKRLARHGVAVSGGSLAAALSQTAALASLPTSVVSSTIELTTLLATGKAVSVISSPVAALTEGVLKAMFLKKIMTTTLMVLALSMVAITFGSLAKGQTEGADRPVNEPPMVGQEDKPPISEKPVEPAAKQQKQKDKEAFTAWGKEVDGVQIGIQLGEQRVYTVGETVTLIVRIRNNGKKEVSYSNGDSNGGEYFLRNPPLITTADDKPVKIKPMRPFTLIQGNSIAPGKEADLTKLSLALRSLTDREKDEAWTLYGTGRFHVQYKDVTVVGEARPDSGGLTLTTGKLELEVKEADKKPTVEKPAEPAGKQEEAKEAFTAWGKEVSDVQAGIGFRPGEKRAYSQGETVTVVVSVRNVGKEAVDFKYIWAFFVENPPRITDADGKMIQLPRYRTRAEGSHTPRSTNVAPGKEVELYEWTFDLQPNGEDSSRSFIHGTGKFSLQCERIVGPTWLNPDHPNPKLSKLATGKLELEVKEAEKPPPAGLPIPKVEKKKVYTPEEVMLEKEQERGKANNGSKSMIVTVEFKVQAVTKPTEIKLTPAKDSPYTVGHGPYDMSLHPQAPKKFEERQFTVILTPKVVKQLIAVGIQDVSKHFMGKTIRVSGRINQHNYSGDDPPIEPHYDLVIEDIGQFEAVD
jgi:RNA polymerase sigma factor (sigma-70 family)